MKKIKDQTKPSVEPEPIRFEQETPYEIVFANPQDEEINMKFLKRSQVTAHMARWFLDHEYNQLIWSDGVFEILELDARKYGASFESFIEMVHPEDRELKIQTQENLKTTFKPIEINFRLQFIDGRIKWINEICNTDFDQEGNPIRSYGTIQDITKYKETEVALQKSEEKYRLLAASLSEKEERLKNLAATKEKFFSIIAHDLRSPFNSILGFLDLLQSQFDTLNDSEKKSYLNLIEGDTKKTLKLLNNLLEWANIQTGQISFEPSKQKLLPIVQNVEETLESALKFKMLKLEYNIPNQFEVYADTNMLTTILRNLISNAKKYSHPGGVISLSVEEKDNFIDIVIADNGIGMSEEIKNRIFIINGQVSIPGTDNEVGSGLGLILCKDFVERHGGEIWVESELGIGSKIGIKIPKHK